MILALPNDVALRLDAIEAEEGIPPAELAHQAIAVWSQLRGEGERRAVGFAVMQIVVARLRTRGPE